MKQKRMPEQGQGFAQLENSQSSIDHTGFAAIVPIIPGHIGERETGVASARSFHKALGVGRVFTSWFNARVAQYGFIEGVDYVRVENLSTPKRVSSKSRQQIEFDYQITADMGKELGMAERTPQGRAIRRYFIACEAELQRIAPKVSAKFRRELKARITAASHFKPMCEALALARTEQGKKTLAHHYTTESNMIARIVLCGLTAKQWAQASGIDGDPRDSMSAEQLEHFSYLEQTNITLIELGQDYHQRKNELTRLSQRWLAKRLGVSHA
ncbi:antA/AntB antirepressor family protein [Serratia marcescens]|uniref:antA/AntB antirepressor family protein n=1 Tax=Serratia marcescens TaxID=615 RepID=UPI00276A1E25|nr:antA/AntB antirepressor family protein [Serratia marcescens]MDP8860704.1 antA/AntB antirepressor family protein [Serratia marcescens]